MLNYTFGHRTPWSVNHLRISWFWHQYFHPHCWCSEILFNLVLLFLELLSSGFSWLGCLQSVDQRGSSLLLAGPLGAGKSFRRAPLLHFSHTSLKFQISLWSIFNLITVNGVDCTQIRCRGKWGPTTQSLCWASQPGGGPWPPDAPRCCHSRHLLSLFILSPWKLFLFFPHGWRLKRGSSGYFVDFRRGIAIPLKLIHIFLCLISVLVFFTFLMAGMTAPDCSQRWPSASTAVFLLGNKVSFEDVEEILFPTTQIWTELGFGFHTTVTKILCSFVKSLQSQEQNYPD